MLDIFIVVAFVELLTGKYFVGVFLFIISFLDDLKIQNIVSSSINGVIFANFCLESCIYFGYFVNCESIYTRSHPTFCISEWLAGFNIISFYHLVAFEKVVETVTIGAKCSAMLVKNIMLYL
jgi:hypothetical protein